MKQWHHQLPIPSDPGEALKTRRATACRRTFSAVRRQATHPTSGVPTIRTEIDAAPLATPFRPPRSAHPRGTDALHDTCPATTATLTLTPG